MQERHTEHNPTVELTPFYPLQNFPLYLRSVNPQNEADLQFQYLVHASIDVVEEKSECVNS